MTTYEVIQHQEVGAGGAASITFSSIPQTYTDLVLVVSARVTNVGIYEQDLYITFNNNTSNRSARRLFANSSTAYSQSRSDLLIGQVVSAVQATPSFSSSSVYIPNYSSSNGKSYSSDSGQIAIDGTTGMWENLVAGLWNDTTAVSSIEIFPSGGSFVQYSSATLIGIKQAALPTPTDVYSDSLLEEQILTSSAASVTFSNLDTYAALGYTNLQIRAVTRTSVGSYDSFSYLRFNGATSGYKSHTLFGNGSSVSSAAWGDTSGILCLFSKGNFAGYDNQFGAGVLDILDAFDSSKYTTIRDLSGRTSGDNRISLNSGVWLATTALTSISLTADSSANYVAGSRFSLYGSK